MFADLGIFTKQEFDSKEQCLQWIRDKQLNMNRSIKLLNKEKDNLTVRTPITNENVVIYGDVEEITWLHLQMSRYKMYTLR